MDIVAKNQNRGFWRTCRIYFRRCRIAVWTLILVLAIVLGYLHRVGLPDCFKKPLLEKLRARGIDLQFSRLRLGFYPDLIAENVRFGSSDQGSGPHLTAKEVRVELNAHLQPDGLILRQGRLVWPIEETNQAPRQLAVENIQAELHLLPADEWTLDNFQGEFAGARFRLSGTLTHASALREWKLFQGRQPAPAGAAWQDRIRRLAATLDRIHFSATPDLKLIVSGDGRDLQSFSVHLALSAPGAETPWGTVSSGRFTAWVASPRSNGLTHAELSLQAADAQTRWAVVTNLHVTVRLDMACSEGRTNLVRGDLAAQADRAVTEWCGAHHALLTAQWTHSLTNAVPLAGQGRFRCDHARTQWGRADTVDLSGHFATASGSVAAWEDDAAAASPWKALQPYLVDWEGRLSGVQALELEMGRLICGGCWRAPALSFTNIDATLGGRDIHISAGLDTATRLLKATVSSEIDPHGLAPALPEAVRSWLAQLEWTTPPRFQGQLALVLPDWTNRQPDWLAEVRPTLSFDGDFHLDHGGAFKRMAISSAQAHVACSNLVWHLSDLIVTRPEGRFEAAGGADERTKDFHGKIRSSVDPAILRPFLGEQEQEAFHLVTLTQPPAIDAEVWGRFNDIDRIGLKGRVEATNFTFRGESIGSLQTMVQYTNGVLEIIGPRLVRGERGEQNLSADGLTADFNTQVVYLTNGFSTAEPEVVARAIGPQIVRAIAPCHFTQPPVAHVHGAIPMYGEEAADLHFDLDGGRFQWWRFDVPHIVGHVHWRAHQVALSEVRADFYGGAAAGSAAFNFNPAGAADFQFNVTATNALLQALMADLLVHTNHLEGLLSGTLVITSGNTADPHHLVGYGAASLRDGLIWDIPLFGAFSPALDDIVPGLGSSRASAGVCTFTITNAIVHSSDLDIRSPAMRLLYRGDTDLDGRVNARVEAELLRDVYLVGPLFSTMFWPVTKMFEFKVTGTLDQPKTEPVYIIPKLVLLPFQMPFHPFRTLKGLLPEDFGQSGTNAPPLGSGKPN